MTDAFRPVTMSPCGSAEREGTCPSPDVEAELAAAARAGNAAARERLVRLIYPRIFNLAIRMVMIPEDAEDATQEIVLKIISSLDSYRGTSLFSTWTFSVAANYLASFRRKAAAHPALSFEAYEEEVGAHADARSLALSDGERQLLAGELKLGCTLGMLQCLDAEDRLVYVLHCFFAVPSEIGAVMAGMTPAAFRQRLSRTRKRMADFMGRVCGLAGGPCSCAERLDYALARGRVAVGAPLSRMAARADGAVTALTGAMEELDAASTVFRAQPPLLPADYERAVRLMLAARAGPLGVKTVLRLPEVADSEPREGSQHG